MNTTSEAILNQLGGGKFLAAIGARAEAVLQQGLGVYLSQKAKNQINYVLVTLEREGGYTVKFYDIARATHEYNEVSAQHGVLAHELKRVFASHTGLETEAP